MNRPQQFTNVDLTPRRHHGYAVLLFLLGTLFPPLAVAARFGMGKDFFLNLVLTISGYIPGHVHNFYIQNIRNNKNNRRTPKWVARYGLVDTSEIERKKKKSQWATRYSERLPNSTHEGQEVEEGQGRSSEDAHEDGPTSQARQATLWNRQEESYYGGAGSSVSLKSTGSAGRWHYPANFEDTEPLPGGKKKKGKKDRWARTEDAHMGVGIDDGSIKKKKKKKTKKSTRKTDDTNGDFINPRRGSYDSSTVEGPEDPEGRQYDPSRQEAATNGSGPAGAQHAEFDHEF